MGLITLSFGFDGIMSGLTVSRRMIVALATIDTLAFLRGAVFEATVLADPFAFDALLLGIADGVGAPCNAAAMKINKLITNKNGKCPLNHRILTMITKRKITLIIKRRALTINMPHMWTFALSRLIKLLDNVIN